MYRKQIDERLDIIDGRIKSLRDKVDGLRVSSTAKAPEYDITVAELGNGVYVKSMTGKDVIATKNILEAEFFSGIPDYIVGIPDAKLVTYHVTLTKEA